MISEEAIKDFRDLLMLNDMRPLVIHTSYLINIASMDKRIRELSVRMLTQELNIADLLGADYLVLHPGSCSLSPQRGRGYALEGLKRIAEMGRWRTGLLIENTAGERGDIGARIEEVAELFWSSKGLSSGICIDTCHAFQAGYDLRCEEGVEGFAERILKEVGAQYIKLIHLNDSKREISSGVDRHEEIGKGRIGEEGFRIFLQHPLFKDIPIILETPKKSDKDDVRNLRRVRRILRRSSRDCA